jgi:hypothetical protein
MEKTRGGIYSRPKKWRFFGRVENPPLQKNCYFLAGIKPAATFFYKKNKK